MFIRVPFGKVGVRFLVRRKCSFVMACHDIILDRYRTLRLGCRDNLRDRRIFTFVQKHVESEEAYLYYNENIVFKSGNILPFHSTEKTGILQM